MATINNDYQTRLLFKQYAGVAAVKLNQPFSDENFRFIPNLFSDDVMIEDIADSAPIGIGELDLSGSWLDSSYNYSNLSAFTPSVYNGPGENNGKSFSQIYPNSKVEFYKNLPLMPVSASANGRVWGFFTDWPTNKKSGLRHSMPFKFDDVLSTYLPVIKYNKITGGVGAGTGTANFTENYINSGPLYWLVDHGTGYVQMYGTTVDLSNAGVKAINDASGQQILEWAPTISIFKYNGKLGVLDLDISGQVQVPQIAANTLLQRQVLADGSANILDLCGNDAIRTQYNYVRKHMFVGYPTQPVIVNSMVDHLQDPSFNHPGAGDNFKYILDVSGTTRLGGQAGGGVDLCGNLNFGFITNAVRWPKLPGTASSRTWQIIGDQAQQGVLDIQYDANADSGIPESLDHTLMRFDGASGYVGIGDISGTKRPATELHIMGAVDRSAIMMDSDPNATMQGYLSCYEPGQWMNLASKKSILFHTEYDNAVTGGQHAMWIDVCGNIGMGTYPNIPKRQLQIHDDVSQNTFLQVTNPATGYTSNEGGFQFGIDGSGVGKIIQGENKPITFYTNNDRRMEIDQDGNVGIGAYDNYGAGIGGRLHVNTQTNNDTVVRIENSSGAATLTTKKDGGNLEIGTTQTDSDIIIIPIGNTIIQQGYVGIADGSEPLIPTGKLHIAGDSRTNTPFLRLYDISDNYIFDQYIGMGHTGANRGVFDLANTGSGEFVFKDSVHDVMMYISPVGGGVAPGGVGIGTLTPQQALDVSGQIRLSTNNAAYYSQIYSQPNSDEMFRIDVQGGRVISYGDNTAANSGVVFVNAHKESGTNRGVALQYNEETQMYVSGIDGSVWIRGDYTGATKTAPVGTEKLHIEGSIKLNGTPRFLQFGNGQTLTGQNGHLELTASHGDGVTRRNIYMYLPAGGVGIGVSQADAFAAGEVFPAYPLDVSGGIRLRGWAGGSDPSAGLHLDLSGSHDFTIQEKELDVVSFGVSGNEIFHTNISAANVLIGGTPTYSRSTQDPDHLLEVYNGQIRVLQADAEIQISDNTATGTLNGTASVVFEMGNAVAGKITAGRDGIYTGGGFINSHLKFYTANTNTNVERMRIDASGQVGIGTIDPSAQLHVKARNPPVGSAYTYEWERDTVTNTVRGTIDNIHGGTQKIFLSNHARDDNYPIGYSWSVGADRTDPMLTIDPSGFVGIGPMGGNPPAHQLHVKGHVYVEAGNLILGSYGYQLKGVTSTGAERTIISIGANNDTYVCAPEGIVMQVNQNTSSLNALHIAKTGNVGIRTMDPSYALHIEYPGNAQIALKSTSPYNRAMIELYGLDSGIRFFGSTTTVAESVAGTDPHWFFGKDNTDNSLRFSESRDPGTNDRLTILPGGNVGINNSSPNHRVDVSGAGTAEETVMHVFNRKGVRQSWSTSTTSAYLTVGDGTFTPTAGADVVGLTNRSLSLGVNDQACIHFWSGWPSASVKMAIDPSGYVGIFAHSIQHSTDQLTAPLHIRDASGIGSQIRVENNNPGGDCRMRFRAKNAANTDELHADIGVYCTGAATAGEEGFLGFKVPYNNTAGAGYKMIIDHSGNVGINTLTPGAPTYPTSAQRLGVSGDAWFGAGSTLLSTYSDAGYSGIYNGSSLTSDEAIYFGGSGNTYFINDGAESVRIATIAGTGCVGIGTTDPGTVHGVWYGTTKLHIDGKTDRGQLVIEGDTLASVILSDNSHTANQRVFGNIVQDGRYSIKSLNDDGTTGPGLLTMLHSGNVGIGTTVPEHLLDISAETFHGNVAARLYGTGTDCVVALELKNDAVEWHLQCDGSETDAFQIRNDTIGLECFNIEPDGKVGISNTNPGAQVDISYAGGHTTGLRVLSSGHHRSKLLVQDYNTSAYFIAEANVVSIGGRDAAHIDNVNINTTTGVVGIGEITPSNGAMIGISGNKDAFLCGTNVKNLDTGVNAAAGSYWQSDGGTIDIRITGSNWATQPLGAHGYLNVSSASHLALKHDGGTCLVARSTEGNRVGIGGQFNADGQYPKTTLEVIGPSVGDGTVWENSTLYLYRMNTIAGGLDNLIKFGVGTDHGHNGSYVMLGQDASNNFTIRTWSGSAHAHRFGIESSTGNVGIGMDSSGIETRLDIDGNFQIDSIRNDYGGFRITDDLVGDYNTNFLMGRGGDSGGFRFYTNYRPWMTAGAWGTGNKKHIMSILGRGLAMALDGTMTVPAITFEDDQDTGIFRPAANQLAITCSGETVMVCSNDPVKGRTVDICGNVSFDLDNLDLSGQLNINTGQLYIKGKSGDTEIILEAPTGGHKGYINIDNSGNMELVSGAGKELQFHVDAPLVGSGGIEAMVIDPSGNVGIGTASPPSSSSSGPVAKLHIEGHGLDHEDVLFVNNQAYKDSRIVLRNHSRTSYFIQSSNTPGTFSPAILAPNSLGIGINAASPIQFFNGDHTDPNNPRTVRLHIGGERGYVGVNTSDPSAVLHCHGTEAVSSCSLRLTRENDWGPFMHFGPGTGPGGVGSDKTCEIQWTVNYDNSGLNTLLYSDGTGNHFGRLSLRADVGIGSFPDICGCLHVRTQTSSRDAFVIDPSWGCIGIGTKDPEALLDIHDYPEFPYNNAIMIHSDSTSNISFGGLTHPSTEYMELQYTGAGGKDLEFWRYPGPNWHPQLSLKRATGYVGIGTSDPSGTLHIYDPTLNSLDILQLKSRADNDNDYLGISFTTLVGGDGPHAAIRCINGPAAFDAGLSFFTTTTSGPPEGLTERVHINHLGNVRMGAVFAADPGAHPLMVHTDLNGYGIHTVNSVTNSGIALVPSIDAHTAGTALLDLVNATPVSQSCPTGGSRLIISARSDGSIRFTNQNSNADFIFQHPTDASSIMIIKNDQNVGIGEGFHLPENRLHIQSKTSDTTPSNCLLQLDTDTQTSCGMKFKCSDVSENIKIWDLFCSNGIDNQGWGVYDRSQSVYRFVIDGSYGKVGIGTNSPSRRLHITGNAATPGRMKISNSHAASSSVIDFENDKALAELGIYAGESDSFQIWTGRGIPAPRLTIDTSGNVGIGAAPSDRSVDVSATKLHVVVSDPSTNIGSFFGEGMVLHNMDQTDGNFVSVQFKGGDSVMAQVGAQFVNHTNNAGELFFTTRNNSGSRSEKMRIDCSGNVGIGTAGAAIGAKLEVAQPGYSMGLTGNVLSFTRAGGDSYIDKLDTNDLRFRMGTGNTDVLYLANNGNVGVGTTSGNPPTARFNVKSSGSTTDQIAVTHSGNTVEIAQMGQSANGNSAGAIVLKTNSGLDKVYLDASGSSYFNGGNIGINTVSPQIQLQISESGGGEFCLQKDDDSIVEGNKLGSIYWAGADADGTTNRHVGAEIACTAQQDWNVNGSFGTRMVFYTTPIGQNPQKTEGMRLGSNGYLGLGLAHNSNPDPDRRLHVADGGALFESNVYLDDGVSHSPTLRFTTVDGKDLDLYMNDDNTGRIGLSDPSGGLILQHNGGSVGIGGSPPFAVADETGHRYPQLLIGPPHPGGAGPLYCGTSCGQALFSGGMWYDPSGSPTTFKRTAAAGRRGAGMLVSTGGNISFLASPETSGTVSTPYTTLVLEYSGNRVGVGNFGWPSGTPSPPYNLSVKADGESCNLGLITDGVTAGTVPSFLYQRGATLEFGTRVDDSSPLQTRTWSVYDHVENDYRLTIDSSGAVRIGGAANANGGFICSPGPTTALEISNPNAGVSSFNLLKCTTNGMSGTTNFIVRGDGKVGIGDGVDSVLFTGSSAYGLHIHSADKDAALWVGTYASDEYTFLRLDCSGGPNNNGHRWDIAVKEDEYGAALQFRDQGGNPEILFHPNGGLQLNAGGHPGDYAADTFIMDYDIINGRHSRFFSTGDATNFGGYRWYSSKATGTGNIQVMSINGGGSEITMPNLDGASTGTQINWTSGVLHRFTSSKKYKKNIVDLEIDTSKIFDLRPVSFNDKATDQRCFGLIAEEVYEEIPELVVLENEEPDAVTYSTLSVLLLAEVKKLRARVEQLEAKMAQQI